MQGLWGSGHDRWRGSGLFMGEYVQELEPKGQTSTLKSKRSSVSSAARISSLFCCDRLLSDRELATPKLQQGDRKLLGGMNLELPLTWRFL